MRNNRIFLLLFLPLFLFGGCVKPEARNENADIAPDVHVRTETVALTGEDFLAELYFLGDSTTAHMATRAKRLDPAHVLAAKNRYLNLDTKITAAKIVNPETGEEETIAAVLRQIQPKYLLITLGVDYGVYYYRNAPESFRRCYEKLLDAVREACPDTRVIAGAIFPVGQNSPVITNEMVDCANEIIRTLSAERGIPFADNNTILKDETGYLAQKYVYSEDGIHLNAAAYEVILNHLAELAPELGG